MFVETYHIGWTRLQSKCDSLYSIAAKENTVDSWQNTTTPCLPDIKPTLRRKSRSSSTTKDGKQNQLPGETP